MRGAGGPVMHIAAFVIPVPEAQREAYLVWARDSAAMLQGLGCLEVVEAWEDHIPTGSRTDFRKAVAAEPGERIVLMWQIWPSRAVMDAAEAAIAQDPRGSEPSEVPFDQRRLILGTFAPILTVGRGAA